MLIHPLFIDVDAPLITTPSGTQTVLSWKGNPTNLKCVAEGYPPAVYSWERGDSQLIGGEAGSVLTITPSADSDFTNYTCIAKNKIGQDSTTFILKPIRKYLRALQYISKVV